MHTFIEKLVKLTFFFKPTFQLQRVFVFKKCTSRLRDLSEEFSSSARQRVETAKSLIWKMIEWEGHKLPDTGMVHIFLQHPGGEVEHSADIASFLQTTP